MSLPVNISWGIVSNKGTLCVTSNCSTTTPPCDSQQIQYCSTCCHATCTIHNGCRSHDKEIANYGHGYTSATHMMKVFVKEQFQLTISFLLC